jgi:putative heme-binding domain-containing protein
MVRFRPESNELEMLSSRTQFGHTFDAWGTHFMATNDNHIFQQVIADQYLKRNPDQLVATAEQSISDHGTDAEVFPITKNPENQLLTDIGVFTSACSITNYLGGAFPDGFNTNTSFTAEPAQNMVHVDHLEKKGTVFSASRVLKNKEFLASTDPYFRPVNLYIGPDGALYVVDFYRQFIEGPAFMDEEVVKTANLYNGTDKGRIYRISATGASAATWMKNMDLGKATNEQLVEKLADVNIWWRQNAQRLLLDRKAKDAVPALARLAQNSTSPLGRLHALWTLEGMNELSPGIIINALSDKETGVRENAIRLAELHLSGSPELVPALLKLQRDPDPGVRYQLLNTLGFINTAEANQARQQLLFKDINDEWVQIAALSAPPSQNIGLLDAVLAKFQPSIPAYSSLVQRLSAIAAISQQPEIIHGLLEKATMPVSASKIEWQASLLKGIAQGLKSRKAMPSELLKDQDLLIQTFFTHPSVSAREGVLNILQIMGLQNGKNIETAMLRARKIADDASYPAEQRAQAVNFLALQNPRPHASFLQHLITPSQPAPVQLAALKMLSAIPDQTVSLYVLKQWPSLTPELRDAALNTFLVRPFNLSRITMLLDAIKRGQIQASSVGWSRSVILMRDTPDSLKARARALFTKQAEKRKDVIQSYQSALQLKGNEVEGKALFIKYCSLCHQRRGEDGNAFGPDLSTVRSWPAEKTMAHVLDPGMSVPHGYDLWNVELKNGEVKQGIISAETSAAVTLKVPGGAKTVIAREDIQSLKALDMSAMPVGLESQISKQQMADLLSFLRSN